MDYTCVFLGTVFIISGVLFAGGKLHTHLSAWRNTLCEEKRRIRIIPLCKNVGGMIVCNGLLFLVKGFSKFLGDSWFIAAVLVWSILAGLDVWYISKSKRYYLQE